MEHNDERITGPFHISEVLENGGDSELWLAHAMTKYAAILACKFLLKHNAGAHIRILGEDYDRVGSFRASDLTPALMNSHHAVELKERMIRLHQEVAHSAMRLSSLIDGSGFLSDRTYADAIKTAKANAMSLLEAFEVGARYELTTDGLTWIRGTGAGTMDHVVSGENEEPQP